MSDEAQQLILAITIFSVVVTIVQLIKWLKIYLRKQCNRSIIYLEKRFNKPAGRLKEKLKVITHRTQQGLSLIISIVGLILVGIFFVEDAVTYMVNYMATYKTAHQRRLDFLNANCEQIDHGYEILNSGKSTYKCPNGKKYKE